MKKLFLSIFLIAVFVMYALYQNFGGEHITYNAPIDTPISTPTTLPIPISTPTSNPIARTSKYKDGTYDGIVADAYYGNMQVQVIIKNGQIYDVVSLQYPNDRQTSRQINTEAFPILKSEVIRSQSSKVNIVSGATDSSGAFVKSLSSALLKAQS